MDRETAHNLATLIYVWFDSGLTLRRSAFSFCASLCYVRASVPDPTAVLQKITQRQTTQDVIYGQLRSALIAGRYEPGQRFKITDLANSFGTSNMPVREALKRLSAEGALVVRTSGTAMVPLTSAHDLEYLSLTRCILEGSAAEAAARSFTPKRLQLLTEYDERHRRALIERDLNETLEQNRAFHFAVYEAAENPVLLLLIENLWLRFGPYVRLLSDRMEGDLVTHPMQAYSLHHQALIAALTRGDGPGARRAIEDDIRATQALMLRLKALPRP